MGPTVWSDVTTSTPNKIFVNIVNTMHNDAEQTRKRIPQIVQRESLQDKYRYTNSARVPSCVNAGTKSIYNIIIMINMTMELAQTRS